MRRLIAAIYNPEIVKNINDKVKQGDFDDIDSMDYGLIEFRNPTPDEFRNFHDYFTIKGFNIIFSINYEGDISLFVRRNIPVENPNSITFGYNYKNDIILTDRGSDHDSLAGSIYKYLEKLSQYGITENTKISSGSTTITLQEYIKRRFIYYPDALRNPLVRKRNYPIITDEAIESIYEHEYKLSYIQMLMRQYSQSEGLKVAYFEISESYKELVDQLYNVMLEALKLWLDRELHWLGTTIKGRDLHKYYKFLPKDIQSTGYDKYHSKQSAIFRWIKENYLDNPDKLISDSPEWVQEMFSSSVYISSPKVYDNIKIGYRNLLAHKNDDPQSKSSWLNYGISLSHNNGSMAQKFIRIRKYADQFNTNPNEETDGETVKKFLDNMSNISQSIIDKWERDINILVRRRTSKRLVRRFLFGR